MTFCSSRAHRGQSAAAASHEEQVTYRDGNLLLLDRHRKRR